MKLTIERAQLLKSLAHVQSVVERRNTIPILSNVLIEAKGEHLHLTATDMDLTIVERVEARIAQAGAVTAPAHTLYDIVRKLPEGAEVMLDASSDQSQLALRSGRSKFALATLPKEDFPAMGPGEMPNRFQLQAGELRSLVDRTRFAISTEETRYYLNGIYLHAAKSTYLGAAHYQNSDVWYHRDQNTITAATTTISNNWFGGFHATPIVVVSDSCGEVLGKAYPGSPFWASGKFEGNGSRTDNWGSASAGFKYAFSSDIQKMAARIDVQSVWTPKPRWGAILDCVAKAVLADPATTVTVVGFLGQVGKCI